MASAKDPAVQQAAEPEPRSGKAEAPPPTAAPPGSSQLPVCLQAGSRDLAASNGAILLEGLASSAFAQEDATSGGCVVGLQLDCPPASFLEAAVGKLRCRRFLALCRAKLYWMIPAWGGGAAEEVPVETQLLLLELEDSAGYGLLAPLIERDAFRTSIRPPRPRRDPPGSLLLRVESGDESVRANKFQGVLYAAAGSDPFELLDQGVAAAARLSGTARPRWAKEAPAMLDCFGWCSWDSFYTGVNPRGLQEGLHRFAEGGTPARFLIIDDGWQQMDIDPELKAEAERGVLQQWAHTTANELEHKLALGRLLAGEDLQAVEPLRVMELLNRRASSAAGQVDYDAMVTAMDDALKSRPTSGDASKGGRGWLLTSPWDSARGMVVAAYSMLLSAVRRTEMAAARWLRDRLEDTSSDSYRLRAFAAAAVGPLRKAILKFYAQASSHSYRLLSVKSNGKFNSIDSGDDALLSSVSDNFGEVVAELKRRSGVDYVLCWHAMMGYWSGCMPGAPGVAKYTPRLVYPRPSPGTLEVDPSMQWVHPAVNGVAIAADPRGLHNDMHAYLHECGVDGVKVDVQSTITMFGYDSGGYAAMGARWHRSLEGSVAAHLPGNNQINSMCCALEDIYNMSNSNIARVGEDFYPALPASHTAHIANAAFTTLMMGVVANPDWDMFQSDHGSSHLHAAARAISGGLVYVSDRIGEHDFSLLRRLVLPDGSVLRCCQPGRPTADCLFKDISRDKETVLKIWNQNRETGVVGLFNVQGSSWAVRRRNYFTHDPHPPTLAVDVRAGDVPYLRRTPRIVCWSDKLQELRVLSSQNDSWQLTVRGGGGHDLITLSPLLELEGPEGSSVAVAPIGLCSMMNSGGAVLGAELAGPRGENGTCTGPTLRLRLRGHGRFLLYASRRPTAVLLDGQPAEGVEWEERRCALCFILPWRQDIGSGARSAVISF